MQKLSIRWIITNHDSAMLMHPLFKAIQSIFSMWWISSQSALFVHRCRTNANWKQIALSIQKESLKATAVCWESVSKENLIKLLWSEIQQIFRSRWLVEGGWVAGGGGSDALHLLWKFISRPQDFHENHFPSFADFILDFHYRLFYKWNPHTHFSSTSATFPYSAVAVVCRRRRRATFQWKNQLEA